MATITIWGEGGYDPSKPNNNMIDRFETSDPESNIDDLTKANSAIELLLAKVETLEETIKTLTNKE